MVKGGETVRAIFFLLPPPPPPSASRSFLAGSVTTPLTGWSYRIYASARRLPAESSAHTSRQTRA